jgi:hypothetical protein
MLIMLHVAYAARQVTSRGSRIWQTRLLATVTYSHEYNYYPHNVAYITVFTLQSSTAFCGSYIPTDSTTAIFLLWIMPPHRSIQLWNIWYVQPPYIGVVQTA